MALLKLLSFFALELKRIKKAKAVFFFPFYHTGGAEKVHLNIVKSLNDVETCIFFTGQSTSNNFKSQFNIYANCFEIFELLHRNYFVRNLFIKTLAKQLNKSKELNTVFGCNTIFFYELLPKLNSSIKKIDLIHAFSKPDYGIEIASLPFVAHLNHRVVINFKTKEDCKLLYQEKGLMDYFDKVMIITNGINIDNNDFLRKTGGSFTVGFIGRGSKEKRPELFIEIAKRVRETHPDIRFVMVGSYLEPYNEMIELAGITNFNEIVDEKALEEIYKSLHLILITSYREGFPLVIMEAMSYGVVPISTNVGGISEYILNNYNGVLIKDEKNTDMIVTSFVKQIGELYQNQTMLNAIAENAYFYAKNEFGIRNFNVKYNSLILKQD